MTLLRCVGLLAGEDLITRPGGKAGWHNETPDAQCRGTHTFRYAVLPLSRNAMDDRALLESELETFHVPSVAGPEEECRRACPWTDRSCRWRAVV